MRNGVAQVLEREDYPLEGDRRIEIALRHMKVAADGGLNVVMQAAVERPEVAEGHDFEQGINLRIEDVVTREEYEASKKRHVEGDE